MSPEEPGSYKIIYSGPCAALTPHVNPKTFAQPSLNLGIMVFVESTIQFRWRAFDTYSAPLEALEVGRCLERTLPPRGLQSLHPSLDHFPIRARRRNSWVNRMRQRNYTVDKGGGWGYRLLAAQAVGVSSASR